MATPADQATYALDFSCSHQDRSHGGQNTMQLSLSIFKNNVHFPRTTYDASEFFPAVCQCHADVSPLLFSLRMDRPLLFKSKISYRKDGYSIGPCIWQRSGNFPEFTPKNYILTEHCKLGFWKGKRATRFGLKFEYVFRSAVERCDARAMSL